MKLRGKAVLLFTAMTLVPVLIAVTLLASVNLRAARVSEQQLQAAVLTEVASKPARILEEVELDATAVAAILGRAAAGAINDKDALESVRALMSTRDTVDAVRFEVPAANVSTLLRRTNSSTDVPSAPEALRKLADEHNVAFGLIGPGRGLVVAKVPQPSSAEGRPPGYVVVNANLDALGPALEEIAVTRFKTRDVRLLIASQDGQVVASFGAPGLLPGSDVKSLPIWAVLPAQIPTGKVDFVSEHVEGGAPMVGALSTVPQLGWAVAIWRPQADAYPSLTEMKRNGIAVALGAALLALLVGAIAARGVTKPILALVKAARLIGQRKWREVTIAASASGGDEIGELSVALGQMSADLEKGEEEIAHQAKLRGDLGRFMSKPLVDAIVRGDHPLALGGKRAKVSVLFADVVGFTPLTEARDAEQVVALLNELFSVLSEIVFRHEGTVDKFIGDCLMAVFGAPASQEDHAARALSAAEDMMRFLETANEEWKEKYDVEVRLGIGVNSGEAIVGNIGSDKRMEYTVIGDVVNVAARLEAIAQPNQVLVSGATAALVGKKFPLRHKGAQRLTGRKAETDVFAMDIE